MHGPSTKAGLTEFLLFLGGCLGWRGRPAGLSPVSCPAATLHLVSGGD